MPVLPRNGKQVFGASFTPLGFEPGKATRCEVCLCLPDRPASTLQARIPASVTPSEVPRGGGDARSQPGPVFPLPCACFPAINPVWRGRRPGQGDPNDHPPFPPRGRLCLSARRPCRRRHAAPHRPAAAPAEQPTVVIRNPPVPASDELLASVDQIDREEIERAGPGTVLDLLARQPGMQVSSNGGPGKTRPLPARRQRQPHDPADRRRASAR